MRRTEITHTRTRGQGMQMSDEQAKYREAAEQTARERAFGTIEWETPAEPVAEEPELEPIAADEAHAVLTGVLDTLGAAHHRPFSRS